MKIFLLSLIMALSVSPIFAQKTEIIAHRGAWKNTKAPQNSIESMQKSVEQGLWGTEFDVHLTKDNILVVNHDNDFYGMDIATSTYGQLLTKKHPNGENIPTLEDYLKAGLKQNKTKLILELKTNKLGKERTLESVQRSYDAVKKLNAFRQVEFIAFDFDACIKFRALDQNILVHYLNGDKSPQEIKEANLSGIDYHVSLFTKNPTWVSDFKALGLKTNSWTVNKKEDMEYLIKQGIDYITTDEPELLGELLK